MGEIVDFAVNGTNGQGYLATPESTGPGVLVIQEWWGLVDHIKDVCDRFAAEGFVALAPDLYHGVATKEPDEANKLMMELNFAQAAKDMSGAFDFLSANAAVQPKKIGVTGFCMGGAMTLALATLRPTAATVPFYGIPTQTPDYSKLAGPVLGHFPEHDDWAGPPNCENEFVKIAAAGAKGEFHVYPGTHHAFFNDSRPEVYDAGAATQAWERTLSFFRTNLR